MELLLDTHILLWLVTDSPLLSSKARAMIEDVHNTCLFSPVSISEISLKHKKHPDRLSFSGEAARSEFITVGISELPLTVANTAESDSLELFHNDRPLRNRKTFLSTMTVMNGTLAFDVAGGRNDRKCVDIDPETIFEEGVTVASPY